MVRLSKRRVNINKITSIVKFRLQYRREREEIGIMDEEEDEIDERIFLLYRLKKRQRYETRNSYRSRNVNEFERDLEEGEGSWLNDSEFLQKYRITRESLRSIVQLIKDHRVFRRGKRGRRQAMVEHQLTAFLKYVGSEGSGAGGMELRNVLKVGYGTTKLYRDRVVKALCSLKDKVITWPDPSERQVISNKIEYLYGIPNCIGIIDGTLLPLFREPQTHDAPDYHGRKYPYSLSVLIVCDSDRLIRYYLAGWPGSAHDNRIWKDTRIYKNPHAHFECNEYIIGDCAFSPSRFLVPTFKKMPGHKLPSHHQTFNDAISSPRAISEQTNGILKGRFPWLRQFRMNITENKNSLKNILEYIDAIFILHNLLVKRCEVDIPQSSHEQDDYDSNDVQDDSLMIARDEERSWRVRASGGLLLDVSTSEDGSRRNTLLTHIVDTAAVGWAKKKS